MILNSWRCHFEGREVNVGWARWNLKREHKNCMGSGRFLEENPDGYQAGLDIR